METKRPHIEINTYKSDPAITLTIKHYGMISKMDVTKYMTGCYESKERRIELNGKDEIYEIIIKRRMRGEYPEKEAGIKIDRQFNDNKISNWADWGVEPESDKVLIGNVNNEL